MGTGRSRFLLAGPGPKGPVMSILRRSLTHVNEEKIGNALAARRAGFSVIPLKARGKEPLVEWAEHQQRRADETAIRQWFTRWPNANYGIVTGAVSGIVVLDVDDPGLLPELERRGLPKTYAVLTGRGVHMYYKHDPRLKSGKPMPGVELRSDGCYVVCPGSIHPTGAVYTVLCSEPIAEAPGWLYTAEPASQSQSRGESWVNPALLEALIPYVQKLAGKPLRFSRKGTAAFRSPYRVDRRPSVFFSLKTGCIHDSAFGMVRSLKELCAEAGIDPAAYGGLRRPGIAPSCENESPPPNVSNESKEDPKLTRSALLSGGKVLTARLLDLLGKHGKLTNIRATDLRGLGLSPEQTRTALAQARAVGAIERVERGVYAITPAGLDYLKDTAPLPNRAYTGHPTNYRQEAYREAAIALQPPSPTRRHPSKAQIAERAGISRSSAYLYDRALGFVRHRLVLQRELSGAVAEFNALLNARHWWIDLFDPGEPDHSLASITPRRDSWGEPDMSAVKQEVVQARAHCPGVRMFVQWPAPSILLLPGQEIRDHLPPGGRLLPDGTVIVTMDSPVCSHRV